MAKSDKKKMDINSGKITRRIEIKGLDEKKNEALSRSVSEIEKKYGKGSVMLLGEDNFGDVETISTGSIGLDLVLGVGGVPKGRIIEIYGPESSGKTTIALQICAEAQKNGGEVAFLDVEHSLDPEYAKNLGIDINRLIVSQPDNGEQTLEIAEALIRSAAFDVIVIDSAAALVPRAEIEGEMGAAHVGLLARLLSQGMRKMVGAIKKHNCTVVFINQLREKVGSSAMFGNPEVTPGGRALKFYSSVRIDVRRIDSIRKGEQIIGNKTRVKVVKNKVAPPFKQAEFNIMYGTGVDRTSELLEIAVKNNIISKSGAWHSYGDERLGQGQENAKEYLNENPDVLKEIEEKVMNLHDVKAVLSDKKSEESQEFIEDNNQEINSDISEDISNDINQEVTES